MNKIYVSFSLQSFSCCDYDTFDKFYSEVLKPIIKFIHKNPALHFSFSLTGNEISILKKKRSEFLKVMTELVKKGQCEVYGGAYYTPVLPLLLPSDRNGQIELLSAEIRQNTGKAPRGLSLYNGAWDSSMLQTMHSCSLDYVLLDESSIPFEKRKYLPVYMTELGKSKDIYYTSRDVKEDFISLDAETFVKKLQTRVSKTYAGETLSTTDHKNIVNISFSASELKMVLQNELLEKFLSEIKKEDSNITLATISEVSKIRFLKVPAYINSGVCPVWAEKVGKPSQVFDYLQAYPRANALYNRSFYVSSLVNQPCKDKAFQKAAKEKLWEGQNGESVLYPYLSTKERQVYYKKLMEAENIVRNVSEKNGGSAESVLSFDYDNDGLPEYICRMKDYFAYISLKGGAVPEFQSVRNCANYADNFSREETFDGVTDGYYRGFFVDHIFTEEQFQKYINREIAGDGVFSRVLYEDIKFSSKHHELVLNARATVNGQYISILKKYIINSSGMNIQYILKNESDMPFRSRLCVESNFAQIDFTKENSADYKVLLATETEALEVDSNKASKDCFDKGYLEKINVVQITDEVNGISFGFEPNENCSYCFYPIEFKRPDFNTGLLEPVASTYVSTLFWDLDIEPGKETEKNFNFTIFNSHKNHKKSSK